jgi:hypothetical protein
MEELMGYRRAHPLPLPVAPSDIRRLQRRLAYLLRCIEKGKRPQARQMDEAEAKALQTALIHFAACPCAKHRPAETQVCAEA